MMFAICFPGIGEGAVIASGFSEGENDALLKHIMKPLLLQGIHWDWSLLWGMDNLTCIVIQCGVLYAGICSLTLKQLGETHT